jgi:hypothetical protein
MLSSTQNMPQKGTCNGQSPHRSSTRGRGRVPSWSPGNEVRVGLRISESTPTVGTILRANFPKHGLLRVYRSTRSNKRDA